VPQWKWLRNSRRSAEPLFERNATLFELTRNLVGEITADHTWGLESPEYDVTEIAKKDVDSALRERLLEWLADAQSAGTAIEAEAFITKYGQGYGLANVVNEFYRMRRDHLITISTPFGPRSVIALTKKPSAA